MRALPHPWWLLVRCLLQRPAPAGQLPGPAQPWDAPPLDAEHLARFKTALGFRGAALPLSYHYLALQRAQLDWMLQPEFPFRLMGMVHMAQTLERVAPWDLALGYQLQLRAEAQGKRNLLLSTELQQQGRTVLHASSLYRPLRESGNRPLRARGIETPPTDEALARWRLPAHAGRQYAWLSGDANPIHLWPLTARWFGLPRPIIHGAHTLARCEAELGAPSRIAMRFLRPLPLPGEARLHREGDAYAVWSAAGRCAELEASFS